MGIPTNFGKGGGGGLPTPPPRKKPDQGLPIDGLSSGGEQFTHPQSPPSGLPKPPPEFANHQPPRQGQMPQGGLPSYGAQQGHPNLPGPPGAQPVPPGYQQGVQGQGYPSQYSQGLPQPQGAGQQAQEGHHYPDQQQPRPGYRSRPPQSQPTRPTPPSSRPEIPESGYPAPEGMVHMASEYDYEGQSKKFENLYDKEDPFETLSVEEQLEDEEDLLAGFSLDAVESPSEERPRRGRKKPTRGEEYDEFTPDASDFYNEPEPVSDEPMRRDLDSEDKFEFPENRKKKRKKSRKDRKVDEDGQDVFVDVETLKVKPIGGERKTKVKVNRYDDRKNRRQKALIVQIVAISLLFLLVGLGLKNAIFPPETLTAGDVSKVVADDLGRTNFPIETGRGFAQDFMEVYLTLDNNTTKPHESVLSYFYTGDFDLDTTSKGIQGKGDVIQSVAYGPTVYKERALTDFSANYTIAVFVQQFVPLSEREAENIEGRGTEIYVDGIRYETSELVEKWLFFEVDVYYNPLTEGMSIAPDSPTLVPNNTIEDPNQIPPATAIGSGKPDDELHEKYMPFITEFLKAYRISSSEDYTPLEQFTIKDKPMTLKTGLDSEVEFDGDAEDAIFAEVYESAEPGRFMVKATVSWISQISENNGVVFDSTYFIVFELDPEGRPLVSETTPLNYFPDDEWMAKKAAEEAKEKNAVGNTE